MNAKQCVATRSGWSASDASKAAAEVDAAAPPGWLHGATACGVDDVKRIAIYFAYADTGRAEVAWVSPESCGGVSAPGRSPRGISETLWTMLQQSAPSGFWSS